MNARVPRRLPATPDARRQRFATGVSGFTLIEVTLAVVLIGLGLLAIVGLGQLAMSNAQALEDDTRSAMLASDIFGSLRTVSENICATDAPPAWVAFWSDFASGKTNLPLQLPGSTCFTNHADDRVWGDGRSCTSDLYSRTDVHRSGLPATPQWSARYTLNLELYGSNSVRVTLHITPGLSGTARTIHPYYTHLTEHGTLP
jgi:type II secretory pathway pseudopilin PulG